MAERGRVSVERALSELAAEVRLPTTPDVAGGVTSRLLAQRAEGVRPPLPGRALWTPRTRLVAATLVVLALLAVAAGVRYAIGAAEIRVVPEAAPSGPPVAPSSLGDPVPLAAVEEAVGFDVAIPAGRAPDAAYVSDALDRAAILAWRADERSPELPGTPWGLVVVELARGDDEVLVKEVQAFDDTEEVELDGEPAFWIDAPHELLVVTEDGAERFRVDGNVLIWEAGGITYRLETPLGLAEALEVAASFRSLSEGT
jgi:hypothetical protein